MSTLKDETYITNLMARRMYIEWCNYKQVEPRPWPYSGDNFRAYANLTLNYTGWDDETIPKLERDCLGADGGVK